MPAEVKLFSACCRMMRRVKRAAFGDKGIIEGLGGDSLHISSNTISIAMSRQLAAAHANRGQRFIAAPVLGRPDMAAIGRLFVFAAGEAGAIDAAKPLLDAVEQRTFVVSMIHRSPTR